MDVEDTLGGDGTTGLDHNSLMNAKQMRKRAEEDARLLANRIALLKQEEAKAWKKIEETRKRAKEIMESRARHLETLKKKEEEREAKEEEKKLRVMQIRMQKQQQLQAKEYSFLSQKEKLSLEAGTVREAKRRYKEQIDTQQTEHQKQNSQIKHSIKSKKREAEDRRKQEAELRAFRAKQELERKIEEENKARLDREKLVERMEQEEMELIQRLQNTQLLQRSAYEDLELALSGQVDVTTVLTKTPPKSSQVSERKSAKS
mmetsp:Transcript_29980/g.53187  ORF Transcript_29980/g.53187 Transcript_29980/m.53187 type:complete len:260 (-) Transcript_29980:526-1305(-)